MNLFLQIYRRYGGGMQENEAIPPTRTDDIDWSKIWTSQQKKKNNNTGWQTEKNQPHSTTVLCHLFRWLRCLTLACSDDAYYITDLGITKELLFQ